MFQWSNLGPQSPLHTSRDTAESTLRFTNTMSTKTFTQDELNTNIGDLSMSKGEFVEKLANALGLVHEDDLEDLDASRESELEAYTTGVEGLDSELTGSTPRAQQEHVDRLQARRQKARNADPNEYGTGIMGGGSSGGGQAAERGEELQAVANDCETIEEFADKVGVDRSDASTMISLHGIEGLVDSPENYSTGIDEDTTSF